MNISGPNFRAPIPLPQKLPEARAAMPEKNTDRPSHDRPQRIGGWPGRAHALFTYAELNAKLDGSKPTSDQIDEYV